MWEWSTLPQGIIYAISLRMDNPFDLIHFRSVCSWWRSSTLATFRPIPSLRCPLPQDGGGYGDGYHILRSRVYLIKSLSYDPPRFWLFKLQEEENGALALQCLFSRTNSSYWGSSSYPRLSLDLLNAQVTELAQEHVAAKQQPPASVWDEPHASGWDEVPFYNLEDRIGFMWLNAENKEFIVLGWLYPPRRLCMYRSFEGRWTEIQTKSDPIPEGITSFKGQFFTIDMSGATKVVNPLTLEVNSFRRSRPNYKSRKRWLVKTEDKILLVEMCTRNLYECRRPKLLAKKGWLEISELNEKRNDWIKVEDLGGRVLFLYEHCSFSCLPNQNIPGFRPNTIIFPGVFEYVDNEQHQSYKVFEFGGRGFRSFGDVPEYIRLFPSPPWLFSNE